MPESAIVMGDSEYQVPWLANFLHSFPHRDLTFKEVNSTFNPYEARYRESLVFWAALPVLWLLLTLLVYLVYFCYRCCQRDVEKKQDVPCLRWSMAILALLTCGAIGVGFYGNEETKKGTANFHAAAMDVEDTIRMMKAQVMQLEVDVNTTVEMGIIELKAVYNNYKDVLGRPNQRNLHNITDTSFAFTKRILSDIASINTRAQRVDFVNILSAIETYGTYRWLGTIIFLCWMVLLCLVLLLGLGMSSKCTLLMFCAFGIFSLVLCWISAGFHLGGGVGLGDFCVAPDNFFQKLSSEQIEKNVINYYIKCDTNIVPNPFKSALTNALTNVQNANKTLRQAKQLALEHIELLDLEPHVQQVLGGLDSASGSIFQLMALVECRNLHKDYSDGVQAVCYDTLPGVVFLLLSAVVTGLLFTILVLLASKAWRHFSRREKYAGEYVYNAEERVPLQNVEDGSHYSYTRGRHGNRPEHVQLQQRGSTPPPAYNSNAFYPRQDTYMNHSIADDQSDLGGRESIA